MVARFCKASRHLEGFDPDKAAIPFSEKRQGDKWQSKNDIPRRWDLTHESQGKTMCCSRDLHRSHPWDPKGPDDRRAHDAALTSGSFGTKRNYPGRSVNQKIRRPTSKYDIQRFPSALLAKDRHLRHTPQRSSLSSSPLSYKSLERTAGIESRCASGGARGALVPCGLRRVTATDPTRPLSLTWLGRSHNSLQVPKLFCRGQLLQIPKLSKVVAKVRDQVR